MARIRSIKPEFFQSDDVSALPLRARLTWIGLWTQCDDQGRTKDHAKLIKAGVWPLDSVSLADIEEDLETLAAHGRIVRYQADGERYLAITNWDRHQRINRPTASRIPPPPTRRLTEDSLSPHGVLTEGSRGERKGKEGKGGEGSAGTRASQPPLAPAGSEPPRKCPEHLDNPDPPPCGACADARRAHDAWRAADAARRRDAPDCPKHRGQPAHNCAACRSEHLGGEP